jgi:hypothetical protein
MINLNSVPYRSEGVIGRVVDGEAVLVLPEIGKVKVLNEVGGLIWSNVDGEKTVRQISELLAEEYEVGIPEAEEDVQTFLSGLEERGVVFFKI